MVLYKLEKAGYARPEWKLEENCQRKYYAITEKGHKLLEDGIQYLQETAKALKK